jgi:hypothetical protein
MLEILQSSDSSQEDVIQQAFLRMFIRASDDASAQQIVAIFWENHPELARKVIANLPSRWHPAELFATERTIH